MSNMKKYHEIRCSVCDKFLNWIDAYLAGGPPPTPDLVLCEVCWGLDIEIEAAKEQREASS